MLQHVDHHFELADISNKPGRRGHSRLYGSMNMAIRHGIIRPTNAEQMRRVGLSEVILTCFRKMVSPRVIRVVSVKQTVRYQTSGINNQQSCTAIQNVFTILVACAVGVISSLHSYFTTSTL
jgi:hypothetical protein